MEQSCFCWHVIGWNGTPYPVLHDSPPGVFNKYMVRQKHMLTKEDDEAIKDRDDKLKILAAKYPFQDRAE